MCNHNPDKSLERFVYVLKTTVDCLIQRLQHEHSIIEKLALRFTHKTCFSVPFCKNLLKIFNFNEQEIVLKRLAKIIMLKMLEQIIMLRILAKIHVVFIVKCQLLCNVKTKFSNTLQYKMSLEIHSAVFNLSIPQMPFSMIVPLR